MTSRSDILAFVIKEYFGGEVKRAAHITGYKSAQINAWMSGSLRPQKATLQYILQRAFVPEFRVICEYARFDHTSAVQTQLKKILGEHTGDPGIYAFYDSLGNLVYLGKATKLLAEMNSALNRTVTITFPKGVRQPPETRKEVVRFVSAYDVGVTEWGDYPRHVESLILRISKPLLNKNIGTLGKAYKVPKEA